MNLFKSKKSDEQQFETLLLPDNWEYIPDLQTTNKIHAISITETINDFVKNPLIAPRDIVLITRNQRLFLSIFMAHVEVLVINYTELYNQYLDMEKERNDYKEAYEELANLIEENNYNEYLIGIETNLRQKYFGANQ